MKVKLNFFSALMVSLTLILLISAVLREFNLNTDVPVAETTESPMASEPAKTTEPPAMSGESLYYFVRDDAQSHVIGIKLIDKEAYPKNFRFYNNYDAEYNAYEFYEVAVLELAKNVVNPSEVILSSSPLHLIYVRSGNSIEQIYRQMSIHYEDGFAVYSHNRETYVTSLSEPNLRRTFTLYGGPVPVKPTDDSNTIRVFESTSYDQTFDILTLKFNTEFKLQDDPMSEPFDWAGKTLTHLASDPSTHAPSLSKITDEPKLQKIILGGSTSKLFASLGQPVNKGWLMGDYLVYDDLLVYVPLDEKGSDLTLYPVSALSYFGDATIAGVKKGMPFASVEQILGVPKQIWLSQSNELAYPLMLGYNLEGFSISIAFDTEFKVSNFMIRIEQNRGESTFIPYAPYVDESIIEFTPEMLTFEGLGEIQDFINVYNACYFNASGKFYRYDFTSASPVLLSQSPMRAAFEIQFAANPSVVAVDQTDGILYIIDLNTYERIPVSGPNYKHYFVTSDMGEGMIVEQTYLSDSTFLEFHGLSAEELVGTFDVSVPKDWSVLQGNYPEGLYWHLANVLSSDSGLSLTPLKGQMSTAYVYRLNEGLSRGDATTDFKYPTNAVILRKDGKIVGSWLMFNIGKIGPSLDLDYLEDIVHVDFDTWVRDTGIVVSQTSYAPSPKEAILTFFSAIESGDKKLAHVQFSPKAMLQALTTNHDPSKQLYHSEYNSDNSYVENIVHAKDVVIIRYYDTQSMATIEDDASTFENAPLGTQISFEIELELENKDPAFNLDQKRRPLFGGLTKTLYGWKIDGFGTGP